jgi:hypothetical protein
MQRRTRWESLSAVVSDRATDGRRSLGPDPRIEADLDTHRIRRTQLARQIAAAALAAASILALGMELASFVSIDRCLDAGGQVVSGWVCALPGADHTSLLALLRPWELFIVGALAGAAGLVLFRVLCPGARVAR